VLAVDLGSQRAYSAVVVKERIEGPSVSNTGRRPLSRDRRKDQRMAEGSEQVSTDEIDKRFFRQRGNLLEGGDLVAKSEALAGSLARPPGSIVPRRFEAPAHPAAWSTWPPLADKLLVSSLGLLSDCHLLRSEGLDVVGVGRSAPVSLLCRVPRLQFEVALLIGDQTGRAQR
jgi:hypothetical protein